MQYFNYVPSIDPIGVDLRQVLTSAKFILVGKTPYGVTYNLYPPLTYILFRPLLRVSVGARYAVLTCISLAAYGAASFAFPVWMGRAKRVTASLMLVFVTGLVSYGFQFELERGQFNVIAVLLSFLAVWIYHRHHRIRLLGYLVFILSVQLKLYPFVFALMFIRDWRDWRGNITRVVLLAAINFGLLFVLGLGTFTKFLAAVRTESGSPKWVWVGNHSVHGFVSYVSQSMSIPNAALWQWLLMLLVLACVVFVVLQAYRRDEHDMDPHLLLACTLASLLLPAISNDYTLAILAGPAAILLSSLEEVPPDQPGRDSTRVVRGIVVCLFSMAYSATLFSYTNKPSVAFLANECPTMMVLLLTVALMSTWPPRGRDKASLPATDEMHFPAES